MKKLLALALATAALVFSASAEWKPTFTVRLADSAALSRGVAKLGEFTGNQMVGMMAAGMMKDMPGSAVFGPARKDAGLLFPHFVENGRSEFAILYPVAVSKRDFLAKFPKAVESNGLIRVKCRLVGGKKAVNYVAFSEDGKWAGASDKPQQARLALECVKDAAKPMDGDLVRVVVLKRGLRQLATGGEKDKSQRVRDILEQIDGAVIGVRVSDSGLDIRGAVRPAKGSEIAKIGDRPLAANPLAFSGKDAVFAYASAAGGVQDTSASEFWEDIRAILAEEKLRTDWLEFTQRGDNGKFTLDLVRLLTFMKELEDAADGESHGEVGKKLEAVCGKYAEKRDNTLFKANGPAMNYEIAIKGHSGKYTLADRFAHTLPEAESKRPFSVGFWSVYSIIRVAVPVAAKVNPEEAGDLNQLMALLPEEGKGGIAVMLWKEKSVPRFLFRVGADEFKAVSAGLAAMAMQGRKEASAMADDADDGDDGD